MSCTAYCDSPLGRILLATDDKHSLAGLWLEGQKYYPALDTAERVSLRKVEIFARTGQWLARYFAGERPGINELKLAPRGSDFQLHIWRLLCDIPYGITTTYGAITRQIAAERGGRMSAQAVGGAVGRNPISIVIPCHRVVGAHGSLTGYAGGIDKKMQLLTLEGADTSYLFVPNGDATM